MHVRHLIAVEADSEEDVEAVVEDALSGYGNGDVWDWYEIGGRWPDTLPNGKNFMCCAENPVQFMEAVAKSLSSRWRDWQELRDKLIGSPVPPEKVNDYSWWPVEEGELEGAAERISESNRETAEQFTQLLKGERPPLWQELLPRGTGAGLLGHYLYKFGKLTAGYYCFDSYFYDGESGSVDVPYLWERCGEAPERQWLAVVDLHN